MNRPPPRLAKVASDTSVLSSPLRREPTRQYRTASHKRTSVAFAAGLGDDVAALATENGSILGGNSEDIASSRVKIRWHLSAGHVKIFMCLLTVLLVAMAGILALTSRGESVKISASSQPSAESGEVGTIEESEKKSTSVVVYVSGAVGKPGLVTVPTGARIGDAIEAAGGLLQDAQGAAINLAAFVEDGQHVHIPAQNEDVVVTSETLSDGSSEESGHTTAPSKDNGGGGGSTGGVINLNTATRATLETIPGIGPVMAQRIIDWRAARGSFTKVEDLLEIEGIGEKTFAQLKDYVGV